MYVLFYYVLLSTLDGDHSAVHDNNNWRYMVIKYKIDLYVGIKKVMSTKYFMEKA